MLNNVKRNILITSAGKRVALVKAFKETLAAFDGTAKVFTTDMNPLMAPAAYVSDKCFAVQRVTHDCYPEQLLQICKENEIGMVVPTIDTELAVLARLKETFAANGINVVVSDNDFVAICRDKRKTTSFFEEHRIRTPRPIDKNNPTFPLFAKPYDGSLSTNIHIIRKREHLTADIMNDPKLMFMEYVDKAVFKEYTVDMYYGRDNIVKCIIPRERIEIRAGEINKGRTTKNEIVDYLKDRLYRIEGCIGCICIQLFFNPHTSEIIGIEINPRFGGGYPLSYMAGGNYPSNLIREYFLQEKLEYTNTWTDNMLMLRYDDAIYT